MSYPQSNSDTRLRLGVREVAHLCPNPYCRQPFDEINDLNCLRSHFSDTTTCGHWTKVISRVGRSHDTACPNPSCREVFETPDELIHHICAAGTTCYLWFQNQPVGPGTEPFLKDVDMDGGAPVEDEHEEDCDDGPDNVPESWQVSLFELFIN